MIFLSSTAALISLVKIEKILVKVTLQMEKCLTSLFYSDLIFAKIFTNALYR